MASEGDGHWKGARPLTFFFGFLDFPKGAQQDFLETHLIKIGQDTILKESRTG